MFGKPRDVTEIERLRAELKKVVEERNKALSDLANIQPLRCSFCGKSQHEVRKLIAGPTVFICDGCVALCVEIVQGADNTARAGDVEADR